MAADPRYIAASMSAVELAAAFLVEDDASWNRFQEYMKRHGNLPPGSRQALDRAIHTTDVVRHSICDHHGISHGDLYQRKFS